MIEREREKERERETGCVCQFAEERLNVSKILCLPVSCT